MIEMLVTVIGIATLTLVIYAVLDWFDIPASGTCPACMGMGCTDCCGVGR